VLEPPEIDVSAEAHRGSVLVCESDLQSGRALKAALRDAGLDFCITPTAEEALVRAAVHIPDAVITGTLPDARRAGAHEDGPLLLDDRTRIDFAARLLRRDGREIRLTPIEYELLSILVRNRGALLIHDALLRDVWGVAYAGDRQTLRAHMANLRRKLVLLGSTATYPGAGYAEDLVEIPSDRIVVERDHPVYVGPNRSARMRLGSCPTDTSASATPSTNPVGPHR
jgi:DNA-binding response OmpR family regulator